ncbi:MAG: TonB-dependent receptor [Phenylobacterium sp.]|nr:TonB-dependent receptor [Phenylobacterium sp.]
MITSAFRARRAPRSNHFRAALLASIASGVMSGAAQAQTAPAAKAASAADAAQPAASAGGVVEALANEVIVTARRTQERAIDVPIPLSVVSGAALEKTGGYTLTDLQNRVPNLTAFNTNPRNSSVGIRGIGVSSAADGLDTSVGVYVDGVYLGRPGMSLTDMIDVDQVEVLRGPQGTLFGRNSSAGVLNITTRKPSFTFGGSAEASFGDYGYHQYRASVTGPLIEGLLAGRLTAFRTDRDGVLDNRTTHLRGNSIGRSGVRGQLLFTPTPKVTARLIAEYADESDTCCVSIVNQVFQPSLSATTARTLTAFKALGFTPTASRDFTLNNAPQAMRTESRAVSAQVDWDLDFATLTSITAWRYWHFDPIQDSDSTPLDIIQVNAAKTRDDQWTQELRLSSKPGRLTWQTGIYLFRQSLKDHYVLNQFGTDASAFYTAYVRLSNPNAAAINIAPGSQYIGDTRAVSESAAVFGQANFKVTDDFVLTAGLRYTHDKRHGTTVTSNYLTPYAATSIPFNYDVTVKNGNWSYLGSATWHVTPHTNLYASYSTGYKAAGLNLNAAVTPGTSIVLAPEHVKDAELGVKQTLFGGRVSLDANLYWTKLTGLQTNITPTNGAKAYLANVGDIRARGAEFDADWQITERFDVSATGSYNDATYTAYHNAPCPVGVAAPCDLTGEPVYQAPRWVANANARYEFEPVGNDIRPYLQAQYAFRSSVFGSVDDAAYSRIKGYYVVNLRAGAHFGQRYEAAIWVNNAFDKVYLTTLGSTSIPGAGAWGTIGQLGTPRTWGVTLRADF